MSYIRLTRDFYQAVEALMEGKVEEKLEATPSEGGGSHPKTDKHKELAAMGHPKDKITKKDVLIARGVVAKEEVELDEDLTSSEMQMHRKMAMKHSALAKQSTGRTRDLHRTAAEDHKFAAGNPWYTKAHTDALRSSKKLGVTMEEVELDESISNKHKVGDVYQMDLVDHIKKKTGTKVYFDGDDMVHENSGKTIMNIKANHTVGDAITAVKNHAGVKEEAEIEEAVHDTNPKTNGPVHVSNVKSDVEKHFPASGVRKHPPYTNPGLERFPGAGTRYITVKTPEQKAKLDPYRRSFDVKEAKMSSRSQTMYREEVEELEEAKKQPKYVTDKDNRKIEGGTGKGKLFKDGTRSDHEAAAAHHDKEAFFAAQRHDLEGVNRHEVKMKQHQDAAKVNETSDDLRLNVAKQRAARFTAKPTALGAKKMNQNVARLKPSQHADYLRNEEVEEEVDQIITENNSFEIEIPAVPTYKDYLDAAMTFVDPEDALTVAEAFYNEQDESLVIESFVRSDIEQKVAVHQKAGNQVSMPKFGTKDGKPYAEYVVTNKDDGIRRKYIHHGTMRRVENMGARGKKDAD